MYRRVLLAGLVLIMLISACDASGPEGVKIAISVPMATGIGKNMLDAAQLALDDAGGKAGEITVELLVLDTSDPDGSPVSTDLEGQQAAKAVEDESVVAYIGPLSTSQAKISMPILNEASMAQVSASATWPGLTKPGYGPGEPGIYYPTGKRHFFRVVPSDDVQGAGAARWALELGMQSAYIINENTAYGSGLGGIFEITAKDIGLEILGHETYDHETVTTEEFETLASHVVEAEVDLVYVGGATSQRAGELVVAIRALDPDVNIMGPDALAVDDLIANFGEVVEGVYGTTVAIPASQLETPQAATLLESYQNAYSGDPVPFSVAFYESVQVVMHAIEQADEITREGVLDALRNMGGYSGVFGTWSFDSQGDISIDAISGMQIQNGNWEFEKVIK